MALKAVNVADVPNLDQVQENASLSLCSTRFSKGLELNKSFRIPKFLVIGHRGHGMNVLQSSDSRMKAIKENTILSFNAAAKFPIDFVEFDVQASYARRVRQGVLSQSNLGGGRGWVDLSLPTCQEARFQKVTKDDCPVIFHDDVILSEENGTVFEKRVTELSLSELLSYGPQREAGKVGKCLLRKTKDGKFVKWNVETDDSLCTLEEAFQKVDPSLGFNIELKFDDNVVYQQDHLIHVLQVILQVVFEFAKDRPIIFSSFHPDAALLVRKLQNNYPVFFLTNGGTELYYDVRRNSLEEAIKVCLEGGLQGIVSEIKGVFGNPGAVPKIKESKLSLLTYGKLNNVPEAVYMQHLMGIDGVIVDFVQEISQAVADMIKPAKAVEESLSEGNMETEAKSKLQFSQQELSFLLKLIPELIQH